MAIKSLFFDINNSTSISLAVLALKGDAGDNKTKFKYEGEVFK